MRTKKGRLDTRRTYQGRHEDVRLPRLRSGRTGRRLLEERSGRILTLGLHADELFEDRHLERRLVEVATRVRAIVGILVEDSREPITAFLAILAGFDVIFEDLRITQVPMNDMQHRE